MGRQAGPDRVLGPYKCRGGWRVVIVQGGTRTFSAVKGSVEEAERLKTEIERGLQRQAAEGLREAVEAFKEYMRAKGDKEASVYNLGKRFDLLFGDALDGPARLSDAQAAQLVKAMDSKVKDNGKPYAVATKANALCMARVFGDWMVKTRKAWKTNPFAGLKVLGRPNRGKTQLRIDEARRWLAVVEAAAAAGDEGAVPAMLCFPMGMRAGEVAARTVRDVDDGGRVIWIDQGKTANARRRLVIPERTRPHLLRAAADRAPDELLFPGLSRYSLLRHVRRFCRMAGVTRVCAHSMRGLLATLAVESGAALAAVADGLGHASPAVTLAHYAAPGSAQAGQVARGMAVIGTVAQPLHSTEGQDPPPSVN